LRRALHRFECASPPGQDRVKKTGALALLLAAEYGHLEADSPKGVLGSMDFSIGFFHWVPSGKHTKNDGKSPFLMGKSTINGQFSIAMLN